ncbi:UPF0716 protein FxsA [Melghiribacillus thermohalophilus]|uniref:UPF0716 protein FxsA n=1 Tax=Melghiribacillus thermohalophilus TaxID=1324956 RepID=A0A4R3N8R9_9BACI|nr:FxsA family protein [Melghiribacillus thermohalophilus]TCT24987.1 UPF0716 protein FxsA [Melghiribacillus thermohalophilus]
MFRMLFLLIVVMSAIEIGVFLWVGQLWGVGFVVFGIILTGIAGAWLAKKQGLETVERAREQLSYGRIPAGEIVDGICILIGAVLLMTPGFVTDIIGFLLLFPVSRIPFKNVLKQWIKSMINRGNITIFRR